VKPCAAAALKQGQLPMSRMRADLLLVAKGLAESRAQARAAIEGGGVSADGRPVRKPSDLIAEDAALDFTAPHPWVSRGGVKLAHALDTFAVDPIGRIAMDVGASTGGFTDVLLTRGAARIYAVDVGAGQLHPRIAADARVVSLEHTDARSLTRALIPETPTLIVCDVSFIGAAKALAIPLSLAAPAADLIVLIKPQFEAGPGRANKSGVLDEDIARTAAADAMTGLDGLEGFCIASFCDSPVRGGEGNLEMLAHLKR
jgi:23S rRNA (cytidine1920-2'-O)/16S rRNA (cytidine1409-2'-O)-methyltransferase